MCVNDKQLNTMAAFMNSPQSKQAQQQLPLHTAGGGAAANNNNNNSSSWASTMLEICVSGGDEYNKESPPSSTKQDTAHYRHSPSIILLKKVGAEFIATFLLIFAAEGAAIMNDRTKGAVTYIGVGLAAGLAVAILILTTGHISGAHMNPAATLAFAIIKEFQWFEVPFYAITQLAASIFAAASLKVILDYDGLAGLTMPTTTPLQAFLVEFIITFILMFVATAVSTDVLAVRELAGPAIGATVFLNNILAGALTGASMNPVRTLGPAIVTNNYKMVWVYIIAPIAGALTGSATYTLMRFEHVNDTSQVAQKLARDNFTTSLK